MKNKRLMYHCHFIGNVKSSDFTFVSSRTFDRKLIWIRKRMRNNNNVFVDYNALRYWETITYAQLLVLIQNMKVESRVASFVFNLTPRFSLFLYLSASRLCFVVSLVFLEDKF